MLKLYCVGTANGQKATIMLEESGLDYTVINVDLTKGEHQSPDYLRINPVGKVPTLIDPALGGEPAIYGTLAIALYLAEKTGRLFPSHAAERARVYEQCAFVGSDLGPAFTGQFIFGSLWNTKHSDVIDYYEEQVHRFLGVMNGTLSKHDYLAGGDYTIADVLAYPVYATSMARLPAGGPEYEHINRWGALVGARPAVQRGMTAAGTL